METYLYTDTLPYIWISGGMSPPQKSPPGAQNLSKILENMCAEAMYFVIYGGSKNEKNGKDFVLGAQPLEINEVMWFTDWDKKTKEQKDLAFNRSLKPLAECYLKEELHEYHVNQRKIFWAW